MKGKDKNADNEWIMAVAVSYLPDKNKYQIEDVDVDEAGIKQYVFVVTNGQTVPIHMRVLAESFCCRPNGSFRFHLPMKRIASWHRVRMCWPCIPVQRAFIGARLWVEETR
jgi:SGF29 tudor-like domain